MKCLCTDTVSSCTHTTGQCFQDLWFFENFSKDQLAKLKDIGIKRTITAGNSVFHQGEPAKDMFLIKSGRIRLSKVQENGNEFTLDFRKAGDVIGENMFAETMDYPLSAWAMEDTVTCGLDQNGFESLVMQRPDIGLSVIRSMGNKMAAMTDRLESMSENSLENKLVGVLSQIAREHGVSDENGLALSFALTHEDLAFLVGAHRVSITKAMKSLTSSGKILRKRHTIILPHLS